MATSVAGAVRPTLSTLLSLELPALLKMSRRTAALQAAAPDISKAARRAAAAEPAVARLAYRPSVPNVSPVPEEIGETFAALPPARRLCLAVDARQVRAVRPGQEPPTLLEMPLPAHVGTAGHTGRRSLAQEFVSVVRQQMPTFLPSTSLRQRMQGHTSAEFSYVA